MGIRLCMREQDLLELYQLSTMYQSTYQKDKIKNLDGFLEMIRERYKEVSTGKDITRETNPRKAGRKPKYTEKQNNLIIELHQKKVSLRKIAVETGCSVGYVQSILKHKKSK